MFILSPFFSLLAINPCIYFSHFFWVSSIHLWHAQPNLKLYSTTVTIYITRTLQQFWFHTFLVSIPVEWEFLSIDFPVSERTLKCPCLGHITHPEQTTVDCDVNVLVGLGSCGSPPGTLWNWEGAHQKNLARGMQKCPGYTETRAIIDHYRQTYHRKNLQIGR